MGSIDPKVGEVIAQKFADKFEVTTVEKAGGEKEIQIRSKTGQSIDFAKAALEIDRALKSRLSLRRSALISLISAAEWFAAQLLHYFLDKYPSAAGLDDRNISYEELKSFDSMDDARQWIVAGRVEEILRGNFLEWIKFLTEKIKIDIKDIEEHLPYCQEACLRRNVLVHNGGITNKLYLKKLPKEIVDKPPEGEKTPVDDAYFEDRLDRFEVVFVVIAMEIWKKLDKSDELRLQACVQLSYDALSQKRWSVCKAISRYAFGQKGVSESDLLMAKVNYWQAFKWSDSLDQVRSDIAAWDVTAKGQQFQAAKAILLDKLDEAVNKVEGLVASGEITAENLKEWPLFQSLRNDERMGQLLQRAEQFAIEKSEAKSAATGGEVVPATAGAAETNVAAAETKADRE